MPRSCLLSLLGAVLAAAAVPALAQAPARIEFVNMGGNDCPPCVLWRATELPRLQAMPEWQMLRYHYVVKTVQAPVPPAMFFPAESRHLQAALKEASNGWSGSPQQAILVDGKVVDYWWGSQRGTAEQIAEVVRALHAGTPLPRPVCAQLETRRTCKKPG